MVDSFGTDAEFNYHGYRKPIPGGPSTWGKLDLDLRQFMTMFRKLYYVIFFFYLLLKQTLIVILYSMVYTRGPENGWPDFLARQQPPNLTLFWLKLLYQMRNNLKVSVK